MYMNSMEFERPYHPETTASLLAKWSFWWLKDLIRLGLQRPIEEKDIYQTLPEHESARLLDVFSIEWDKEKQRKHPSLFNVIVRVFVKKIIWLSVCFTFLDITLRSIQPLCLGGLVMYFSQPTTSTTNESTLVNSTQSDSAINVISREFAYLYAGGILTCAFISMLINTPFTVYAIQMGLRIHSTCRSVVYQKTLKITKSVSFDVLNGRVINLMSTDVACFDNSMFFVHLLWKGPIELILFGYLIYLEIGFYGWIGLGFISCFVPIQLWMGKMAATFRLRTAKRTDERVKIMNEVIQGIQVIKMYAWEASFASLVDKIRKKELKAVRGTNFVHCILISFNMVPRISIFFSLASYVYCGNVFVAKQVFIVTAYFNFLYSSMLFSWPMALISLAECYVSIKRIQTYLLEPESKFDNRNDIEEAAVESVTLLKESNQNGLDFVDDMNSPRSKSFVNRCRRSQAKDIGGMKCVVFENATALWRTDDDNCKTGLKNISLNMSSLTVIIGSVGSGKSTLLYTILGELELDEGQLQINGSLSYASQEPWLFEANVRQNILFTEEYNEKRYNEVIRVCALERDLEILPHGDYTIVGERGITLSGGQRARINLARAIYRKVDIYLLDDPLSAVDAHVGTHIFENCIKGFLKNKVCILVTHQSQYLTEVNDIILLNSGSVAIRGNLNQLKKSDYKSFLWMAAATISDETEQNEEHYSNEIEEFIDEQTQRRTHEKQILLKENQTVGAIGFHVFKAFFAAVESRFLIICVLAVLVIEQISTSAIDLFVSKWVNWESGLQKTRLIYNGSALDDPPSHTVLAIERNFSKTEASLVESTNFNEQIDNERFEYAYIYTVVMCFIMYLVVQRGFTFFYMCLRASRRLHDKLFRGIIHAPMLFFNRNSSGRIINRFAKDISGIDATLPEVLYWSLFFLLQALGNMILVSIANYWLLAPTCVLLIMFCTLRQIYIQTGRSVKRIESLSRSPIYTHTNATISGLATIRACNAEQRLMNEFNAHQDVNVSAGYLFHASSRALSMWLEASCFLYLIAVIITFFIFDSYSIGGNVGLAITQIIYLNVLAKWGMRETTELENQMTFVERVDEYTRLKSEPESDPIHDPGKEWPQQGDIQFDRVTLKYSADSEPVLKQINLLIKPQEKIGIVGRTGAGKSSIIQALFRLAHNEGTITINGIDISTLGLHDLRRRISIIPQDPILFSGTIRDNLDPFQMASDDELWNALERAELKSTIKLFPGGLNCKMLDGGSNFSMGQRQLVCLARAILRNNKILILDEATANVDADTDKFIQTTIREKFADCTVLTIAHRLHTVMDSDRVLVMDDGEIAEYDHPFILLQRPHGFLRKLVNETESSMAAQLLEIARQSYERKSSGKQFL